MSLYIPKMSDTPAITIPGLAANFEELDSHLADTNNPHSVTAAQVPYTSSIYDWDPGDVAAGLDVLAGSRIVDHNFDVVDPPNGYYVRWESGLQVCWIDEAVASFLDRFVLRYKWVYPAGFVAPPAVASTKYSPFDFNETDVPNGTLIRNLIGPYLRQKSSVSVALDLANSLGDWSEVEDGLKLSVFAIGRWK